jgi:cytochrome P450
LTDEVRQAFQSEDEITFNAVSSLPYLKACIEEGLRLYPPTPGGLPRTVPEGGATVCGTYVPEKVCLLYSDLLSLANHHRPLSPSTNTP